MKYLNSSIFMAALVAAAVSLFPSQTGALPVEPLGQSSRRTSLVISEIMFNPLDRADGKNLEFIELFNSLSTSEDISGWRLDGDADFTFPPNTVLPAGAFLVVAQFPAHVESVYGITGVLGPFSNTNSLPNTRGTIQLRNRIGAVFLEAHYDTETPWPIAADGAGHSLVLARPSYGEGNVEAWAASDSMGGSPGRLDPVTVSPLRNVVINEFLAHTDDPEPDFIELYNHGNQAVDISGCFLSDARNTNKFTIPPNTILSPRGFIAFDQSQLGFSLGSGGERIYFRNGVNSNVLDAVRFEAQANGVSSGRYPDGAPGFSELTARTPGTNNAALLIRDIVINEIMYSPISKDSDDEFVELYNRGSNFISLAGWRLQGGIGFTFPLDEDGEPFIPPNGYVVIAKNAAHLRPRYANLNVDNTVGDYNGSLANGGERIALTMPDPFLATNGSVVSTNFNHIVVDEVTYRDGGRWGRWADGGGSSLELLDARSDNRLAANWADSDETAKAPWTTVSVRGVLDNGTSAADQLQVLLQGAGECLIDNVEVVTLAGANVIANSTFESGATGWTAEGTQEPSGWEMSEGFNGGRSYHVRATDRGDNQVNRIRTPLTAVQPNNTTNTIRANVRWLRGHPEILFRLRGNWLEAAVSMNLPTNLGTPGAVNSRVVPNAPPAIFEVTHNPPVPGANAAVVVTARVYDSDGLSLVRVRYRIDPSATVADVTMHDDGTGGDAVAGDGLYSAIIPGQPANTLVAFRVEATDGFLPAATAMFPNDAPTRECLVRFGESVPPGSFPSYRIWMTQASFNAWDARNNLNNTLNDVTFVLGNHRVIYNAGASFAGSPYIAPGFTTPTGNRCGYAIEFPTDEPFLGDTGMNIDWPGGHGGENTAIQEEMAYWIADQMNIPFSHRYFIRLTVNGVTDMQRGGVFEAALQPGSDFLKQWSPGDSEGDFFRIDRAFEFSDAGGTIADPEPQLRVYTTPDLDNGGTKKKTEKYRWYWLKRSFESANDYTNLFVIADALNAVGPEPYTSQTEGLADVEQWMGIFAVEHIINNFDSWGHDIGKNMYMFKPKKGRWQLYMFDLDWLMLVAAGSYPPTSGPLFLSDDPTITRMYNHPPFRRAYFRAVQDAVDRAFVPSRYEAVMDAKYAALVANGITLCDGQTLTAPTAVKTWFSQRRTFLTSQLATAASPFTLSGPDNFNITSNLATLTGTAPITVKSIEINGATWPVTWTSVSNWTIRVPLAQATNLLTILGYDSRGNPVAGASNAVTVVYSGSVPEASGSVVINEIMYHPIMPGAEFVELFNTSVDFAFDLAGWQFNGLDYTFPEGSFIAPRGYLVLARDREAAMFAYGTNLVVFDVFNGNLQSNGETLTLIRPGDTNSADLVIDQLRYESAPPWPASPNGAGPSLQLIDAAQDNARVSNWAAGLGWQRVTRTGNIANGTNLLLWLSAAGNCYLDDVSLVGPAGTNIIANSSFESGAIAPWIPGSAYAGSTVVNGISHSGNHSLFVQGTAAGGSFPNNIIQQVYASSVERSNVYTLAYYVLHNTNSVAVTMRSLPGNNLTISIATTPVQDSAGAANLFAAVLPPYDPLWLNEIQPNNTASITDNNGEREPWIELYNAGATTLDLAGYYLANNYDTNLLQWPFPAGGSIRPGEFKIVWADGQPAQTSGTNLHTNFRLASEAGSLALVRVVDGRPQITDYLNYSGVGAGLSYGSIPDGGIFERREFYFATPGGANNAAGAPLSIFINEWMAANAGFIADPADGDFDDWFELYNPNSVAVNLGNYSLTDRPADPNGRWTIPVGVSIPANGFLLVWADEETGQNSTNSPDLHAGFKLGQDGEAIGLFAPDGSLVDSVTFGPQTNNVSHGRWPDGAPGLYFMPIPTPRAGNVIPGNPAAIQIVGAALAPNGNLVITWSAEAGKTYRVQFKNDLAAPMWADLTDVTATGPLASSIQAPNASPRGFYRIQLVGP